MANFESGISRYITGYACVSNAFPVDLRGNATICCEVCRFYRAASRRCGLTDEVVSYPGKYVGGRCPLEMEGEEDGIELSDA